MAILYTLTVALEKILHIFPLIAIAYGLFSITKLSRCEIVDAKDNY